MIYIFEHRKWIVKNSCYHILYIMFENIANTHTFLLKRLSNFVHVKTQCNQFVTLYKFYVTTICYFEFFLVAIFFITSTTSCQLYIANVK
jgi:hypothetical protein